MIIDMKGYKVIYDDKAFRCLAVEPILFYDDEGEHVDKLRVFIIDHEAGFAMLEGHHDHFSFVKDPKIA